MKKIYLIIFSLILVSFLGVTSIQKAEGSAFVAPGVLPELPNPGLSPGNFFYFLDGWGESIRSFFIFNLERKAMLQTEWSLERIAEINALLSKKGVDAPGLSVAKEGIQRNIIKASEILERQKGKGIEVAQLAERLETDFNIHRKLLNQVFDSHRDIFKAQIVEIRRDIKQARQVEEIKDFDRISELRSVFENVKIQRERLAEKREIFQNSIVSENKRIKEKMSEQARQLRVLQAEREALAEEEERVIERIFEEREIVIEIKEEVLEIQLKEAILIGDNALVNQIQAQLLGVELYAEVLEIEEERFEQKIEAREAEIEIATEILLERIEEQGELRMEADQERKQAKRAIKKAWAKANEQNIYENPIVMGLIKQAEQLYERGLILFEQKEYKKSYFSSEKAMDFAEKVFKLISVKERLRRERPDLPIFPSILPVEPTVKSVSPSLVPGDMPPKRIYDGAVEIIDSRIASERVKIQIKTAEQIIEKAKRLIIDGDIVSPSVAIKLIERAEDNIDKAIALFEEGIFDSAHRHAIRAEEMASRAYRIIERKLQAGEMKIIPEPTQKAIRCQTDADCIGIICPMVIGGDTPQCRPEKNICFCGPGKNIGI